MKTEKEQERHRGEKGRGRKNHNGFAVYYETTSRFYRILDIKTIFTYKKKLIDSKKIKMA